MFKIVLCNKSMQSSCKYVDCCMKLFALHAPRRCNEVKSEAKWCSRKPNHIVKPRTVIDSINPYHSHVCGQAGILSRRSMWFDVLKMSVLSFPMVSATDGNDDTGDAIEINRRWRPMALLLNRIAAVGAICCGKDSPRCARYRQEWGWWAEERTSMHLRT